jgi:hypothetical protein
LRINGDKDRLRILQWLERTADVAMTLDVPTGPVVTNPNLYNYKSSSDCLNATLEHLKFFETNRQSGELRLLNVLQGNNASEADIWYNQVRRHQFDGWAFAGFLRNDFYQLCRRIIIMANDGELQGKSWIHVLGTAELETAVLLTALQRSINRNINSELRISYDTSGPFRQLAFDSVYTLPAFSTKEMTMGTKKAPDDICFIGSQVRWPWPSPIGNRMVMGDFSVPGTRYTRRYRDQLSDTLAAHHNLGALCWGISTANRIFVAECLNHDHTIGKPAGAVAEAIENTLRSGNMAVLNSYSGTFAALHGSSPTSGDEERDVE